MPILTVHVGAEPDPELARRIAHTLTDLTARLLGKDPRLTAVAVDFIDPATWFIAGRSLRAWGQRSVNLEIKVSDETNTRAEKAHYLHAVFEALQGLLGPLHPESYLHVHDVRASAYGYGGRTQEWRMHHPGTDGAPTG